MTENEMPELIFPCEYPVKMMGKNEADFIEFAILLVMRHVPELAREDFAVHLSSGGKYVSINTRFIAQSRTQVDALYQEMRQDGRVLTAF